MSGYELLDAFDSHLASVISFFVAYISATSAFLVVAYLAAPRLPSLVARLVVGLYSLTAVFFLMIFQRHWTSMLTIRDQMGDAGLSWYPAVYEPPWVLPTAMWVGVIVMSILYVGSVWYFVSARRGTDGEN